MFRTTNRTENRDEFSVLDVIYPFVTPLSFFLRLQVIPLYPSQCVKNYYVKKDYLVIVTLPLMLISSPHRAICSLFIGCFYSKFGRTLSY